MFLNGLETNSEVFAEIGRRIQRQRINMNMTQEELAEKAGVSMRTLVNVESGNDCKFGSILNILRAENILGNIQLLVPEEQIRPSDILALGKKRQRVRKVLNKEREWKWGDEK